MRAILQALTILSLLQLIFLSVASFKANPDPLNTGWYVTDFYGNPVNGAHLTIYYSTSPSGSFTAIPSSIVEDRIANAYQNPVITGFWNNDHPAGMAKVDLHLQQISGYYFYVIIEYNSITWQWPLAS